MSKRSLTAMIRIGSTLVVLPLLVMSSACQTPRTYARQDGSEQKSAVVPQPMPAKAADTNSVTCCVDTMNDLRFSRGSYQLQGPALHELDNVLKVLDKYPEIALVIRGHSSSEGSTASNLTMSRRRGEAVRDYLLQHGVEPGSSES